MTIVLNFLNNQYRRSWVVSVVCKDSSPSEPLVLGVLLLLVGVEGHLLVVVLESCQVLTSLGELSLLHALAHVPEDKDMFTYS